jgi:hypothetical protein
MSLLPTPTRRARRPPRHARARVVPETVRSTNFAAPVTPQPHPPTRGFRDSRATEPYTIGKFRRGKLAVSLSPRRTSDPVKKVPAAEPSPFFLRAGWAEPPKIHGSHEPGGIASWSHPQRTHFGITDPFLHFGGIVLSISVYIRRSGVDCLLVVSPSPQVQTIKLRNFFRVFARSLLIPIVALAVSVSAHGATRTWSGSNSATWTTGGNWVGGTAPNGSISTSTGGPCPRHRWRRAN